MCDFRLSFLFILHSTSISTTECFFLWQTYCVNQQIADSACSATAYLCGAKTNNGVLGLTAAVPRYNCEASLDTSTHLDSIAAWAIADGRDAGENLFSNGRVLVYKCLQIMEVILQCRCCDHYTHHSRFARGPLRKSSQP